jgi:hypothetical protein
MNPRGPRAAAKRGERGYALLVVVFLVTCLLLTVMAVSPNILTEGRREKEKEMVWRGKQYTRGVKLYYRKLGRFPTSLDDLTKPKMGSIRVMRQAYKDPMNEKDGAWRFIYVGSAGQLIGSLKPPQTLQLPQAGGMGAPANSLTGSAGAAPQPGINGIQGQQGMQPGGTPSRTNPPSGTNPPTGTGTDTSSGQNDPMANPQSGSLPDTSNIIGGNIIGVGSKINKRSIMVYEKAKNYQLFEFIWDPSKDNMGVGQPGMQTGTGLGQPPGQTPFGQQPGQNPSNPPQNPQQPPQNPPPQQ